MASLLLNDVKLKAIIDSVGIRTEYLGIYAAWIAFKSSVREGEIEERIDLLKSYCFQTKAGSKVKDRYRMG